MSVIDEPFKLSALEEEHESMLGAERVGRYPDRVDGTIVASLHGFDCAERPLITGLPGLALELVVARSTVLLTHADAGKSVVVCCERGDVRAPIVLGVLRDPGHGEPDSLSVANVEDRLVLTAEREITLRCGHATITLTRAGKIIIEGTYVVSRSSGYNKLKGAAIDIN